MPAYTFLADGEAGGASLTFTDVDCQARAIAAELQRRGLAGQRVLLLYPPGLDFVVAFFGCLYAGALAVPSYPPRSGRAQSRLRAIVRDARPAGVLTTSAWSSGPASFTKSVPELHAAAWLASDGLDLELREIWREPTLDRDSLAFLQYTSGSTADPKGVMVSHGNLLHNQAMIQQAFGQSEHSVIVGWLPLYHDMGLIGNVLQPLYVGASCILMSPVSFLQHPVRWLQAVTLYGGTTSGGPNFAYELCVRKVTDEQRRELDLSRWEVAFNGAEPVRSDTLSLFARAFAPCGFRREAFYPCYGLAEATLFVCGGQPGGGAVVDRFAPRTLESGTAVPEAGGRPLVGCGSAWGDQRVVVVDPESGTEREPGQVGEVWVSGASVAAGYWERGEQTEQDFGARLADGSGPFLRTGDLGFFQGGELFITGRRKDLIILRGRNLFPQDVEQVVEACYPGLRVGGGAAFSVDRDGEERLVVVQEVERRWRGEAEAAAESIRRAVAEEHEVQVHEVVLIREATLPKTSSGKVRRSACRQAYLSGTLTTVARSRLAVAQDEEGWLPPPSRTDLLAFPVAEMEVAVGEALRGLAARVLGVPAARLSPDKPLTGLGLDSLSAVELRNEVELRWAVALPMARLLEGPSTTELAEDVVAGLLCADERPRPLSGAPPTGEPALSHGQRALWFLDRLAPESTAYIIAGAARLTGELDDTVLRHCLTILAARHPSLRTTFHAGTAGPVQRVHAPEDVSIGWREEAAGDWDRVQLLARLREEACRPFDLERGPLLRVVLFRLSAREHAIGLAVHHLVADFWSLEVLIRELRVLYARAGRGAEQLPPLHVAYSDWARWEAERLAGEVGERLWRFWEAELTGAPLILELPTDRPRPLVQTYRGTARRLRLDPEEAGVLRSLAREQGATLYMLLLASFGALLHRYTGSEEVLLGSPTVGRESAELDGLVGYFVNPVVIRCEFSGGPSCLELLERVRRRALRAFAHQELPFALLAERLQPERDPGRSPIFQVAFALQKSREDTEEALGAFALGWEGGRLALGELEAESLEVEVGGAPFDLSLVMAGTGEALGASLRFNTDLFDGPTAERILHHFAALLAAAASRPAARLTELPLLAEEESAQILYEWNATERPVPAREPVHSMVARWARRTPEAPAVVSSDGKELTYGELAWRAGRLADYLRAQGLESEGLVGLCLERSSDLVVGELAILAAGGAFLPLDPAHPPERLALMLADSGCRFVLTWERLCGRLSGAAVQTILLDGEAFAGVTGRAPGDSGVGEALAYVVYTSGSTGDPKGTALGHAGLANLAAWHRETYDVGPGHRATLLAGVSFDASVWEIWPYLTAGASLWIPPAELLIAPRRLMEWMAERGISHTFLPTPLAEQALAEPAPPGLALRWLLTGGDRLHRRTPPEASFLFVNHYGPTEATVVATAGQVPLEGSSPGFPSIGRPIAETRVYILDSTLQPVPMGVAGELYVGGAGLARGYPSRPALTAERFLPDPFSSHGGQRLYRTGDRVRFRPDGEIEFLGRLDTQVKIRGFRIELGEIEAALTSHPEVCAAAALVLPGPNGVEGGRAVAYVVPAGETPPTGAELRIHLAAKLPEAMIPGAFVPLQALPLTPNGKVDRHALARLSPTSEARDGAPRAPVEELLAGIWAEVLGLESVGVNESFFHLGGHSLLAARAAARVREVLGWELPLAHLFEAPSVAALAREIGTGRPAPPPIRPSPRTGRLPLSFAQERLWFLDQFAPGGCLYNLPGALRLQGGLDVEALRVALVQLAERHETLRTTFHALSGGPVQAIAEAPGVLLPQIDLSGLPAGHRDPEAQRLTAAEARRPFDLEHGPLFRAGLLRLAADDHLLLVTLHHAIADGWSIGVLTRDLGLLYGAAREGRPLPLAPLPVQFADYALWQREWLRGEVLSEQLIWWRERLADVPAVLGLPADRPRPAVPTQRGGNLPVLLLGELARDLAHLARAQGATMFMTLLAAFGALLGRMTGEEDLVIGSPVANRDRAETAGMIGFLVNLLAVRCDVTGAPGFSTLLGRVREVSLGAWAHQDLPFEKLVKELRPERSLAHAPIFQVMLALRSIPVVAPELAGLTAVELRTLATGAAKFDLTLSLEETSEGLVGSWEYSRDLFDRPTVERLACHFQTLLEAVVVAPEVGLAQLPLLSLSERQQLLEWGTGRVGWDEHAGDTLAMLFEARVRQAPDARAVTCEGNELTYSELNARANRLAHLLRQLGVRPEVRVGLCAEHSLELVVGLLGIVKAGGAYLPLDPSYPRERLAFLIQDAGVQMLVGTERALVSLPLGGIAICLDGAAAAAELARCPETDPPAVAEAENIAYVIYTSGSTGKPKGVLVTHGSVAKYVLWSALAYGVEGHAGSCVHTSLSFDLTVTSLLTPLLAGTPVHLLPDGAELEGLARTVAASGCGFVKLTPPHLELLRSEAQTFARVEPLTLVVGGEALQGAALQGWPAGARIFNEYGPTEATVGCCVYAVSTGWEGPVPIGRPIAGARLGVLDGEMAAVPVGAPGELWIGGSGLARGYLGRPDLTAERFVPDPYGGPPGSRLYRTGDRARWRADGHLEFLGRLDEQIKIRGYRIEPGEVEAALTELPGVEHAAVIAREDRGGQKRLLAYLVGPAGVESAELRRHLGERLPAHLVPTAFVRLDALPLTTNGKVDRKALLALAEAPRSSTAGEDGFVAPRTAQEKLLAGIWAEVLGLDARQVGVYDDFFEAGGHSLLAGRVMARLRTGCGVELPWRILFERRTIAGLAEEVERATASSRHLPSIRPVPRQPPPPLSFAQERLWFLDQLEAGSAVYNIPIALDLRGPLLPASLASALAGIVCRHEALRTAFVSTEKREAQVVLPAGERSLPVVDLGALPALLREPEADRLSAQEAARPFDLTSGELLRAGLLRLSADEHRLLLTLHHIAGDGRSTKLLLAELAALSAGGGDDVLPPLPVQYADYAVWQREWLTGEVLEERLAYWRERLTGVPSLDLVTDRPRPAEPGFRGTALPFTLGEELTCGLRDLARQEGATLFMALLAGFAALLSRTTGQEDFAVGTVIENRPLPEVESLIGFFANTLPVRADLAGAPSFTELLGRIRGAVLGAYSHQDLPFERLVEELQSRRDLSRSPIFQAMLVFEEGSVEPPWLAGLETTVVPLHNGTAKFDLTLAFTAAEPTLAGGLEFRRDLFDAVTGRRLLGHLERLLAAAAAAPGIRVMDLPLLGEAESQQLLMEWNATSVPYPAGRRLHELFEEQVARSPDAVAVVAEGGVWTYRELNRLANQLARYLRRLGVGPEVRVAVCLERSLELVIALYGVLKAGGAYVPLDPDYPQERLAFMLSDACPAVLVTHGALHDRLPEATLAGVRTLWLDQAAATLEAEDGGNPTSDLDNDLQLAYMIYTSGSTGRPKGAMVSHRSICNRLLWMQNAYRLTATDVVIQKTPFSFDVSVWELFWPLLTGARLVMARPGGHRDAAYLLDVIVRERVSVLHFVPSMLRAFLEEPDLGRCRSLRTVVVSGEALGADLERRFFERLDAGLENLYGPTEASVDVTVWSCRREAARAPVPIGRPIANTRIHLLDRGGLPVPLGTPGELCIGGVNVGRGYLARPDLTAEKFVPDPFGDPGSRLYRTGDLARHAADGALEFLGRLDHQVKVRGVRIEPGEVEAILAAHPAVLQAAVVAWGEPGESRLTAYVVPDAGREPGRTDLREYLRDRLPEPMVPSAFVFLEALPLSANGKLDRAALPSPVEEPWASVYVPPRNESEARTAEIWAELLGLERVGAEDNFFSLGGDSIRAVRLVSRMNEALAARLRVQDVFRHQTLAALAAQIPAGGGRRSLEEDRATGLARIEELCRAIQADPSQGGSLPEDAEDFYPLSGIEKGMVYYSLLLPEEPIYHDQFVYLLSLPDLVTFFTAWRLLVDRHPIFRSTFHVYGFEQPMKVVRRQVQVEPEVEDLTGLSEDLQRQRIDEYRTRDLADKFTFDGDLLWRLKLFRLGGDLHCSVWTWHHALLDGWSNVAFWVEMNELCARADLSSLLRLPRLASDYKDYVAITLGRQHSPEVEEYWRGLLAGHGRNRLPFNRSRARPEMHDMGAVERRLPGELLDALRATARASRATLQAVCLSAHVFLLHVLAAEDDIVTGVVSHDRPGIPDADKIIACFLSTFPMRFHVAGLQDAEALIRAVQISLGEAKEHEVPLSDIAALVGVKEDTNNPFFDTLFNFMDFHIAEEIGRNLLFRPMTSGPLGDAYQFQSYEMTNTLLDIEVSTTRGDFVVKIKYARRYFDPADGENAVRWYESLLGAFRSLDTPLEAEMLLSEAERLEIIHRFNDTGVAYPRQTPVYRLFEAQAKEFPDHPAVSCAGQLLTYGELNERANRLARHLLDRGVQPGDNVGLLFDRSVEMVVGLLAIEKAVAAYVPLEPAYPPARKGYILRKSEVRWVLADGPYELHLADDWEVSFLDIGVAGAGDGTDLDLDPDPCALAYTIFTSGSTGEPKGVMMEHHSVTNLVQWVNREFAVDAGTVILGLSSICFDLSVYDILGGLAGGAEVIIAQQADLHDPVRLCRLVDDGRITFWNSVPSTMGLLVTHLEDACPDYRNEALRVVFLSGDWIPLLLPARIARFFPAARIISLGGATEGCVWSIWHPIDGVDPAWASIPYGRPIDNSSFYILDRNLSAVPAGVAGDLYIGGVGVAKGYANDPGRTAASYLPDRFSTVAGTRLYRTGDLGRMLPDGNIEFLGRMDHQVKIRGFRVELGEVESRLLQHPEVRDGVVVDRVDAAGEKFLCAYVVAPSGVPPAELKRYLAETLPEYMIPTTFIALLQLPLTANGKLDRRALPEPGTGSLGPATAYVAPADETEAALVEIWQEILGAAGVGTRHDFFELGGHSLSAIQALARIRRRFGVDVPLRGVFENPTVEGVARLVRAARPAAGAAAVPALRRREGAESPPLSFAQERLWFLHRLEPKSPAFNLASSFRLTGPLDVGAFAASLDEVARRHEAVRTRFTDAAGKLVQIIDPPAARSLPRIDLADLPAAAREREVARLIEEEAGRPFDLERDSLLRTGLARLAADDHVALFTLHHLIGDGWSLGVLAQEITALYDAFSHRRPSPLSELPVQYADYVMWQREWLRGEILERQLAYWHRRLGGELPVLELPEQRQRPETPSFRGAAERLEISAELADALTELARRERATLFMALLAGFEALLHLYTGQEDLLIGTNVANRHREEIRGLIGFFVNNLVLRTDLSGNPSFRQLLGRVRETALEAYAHQDVPFERVIEDLRPQRRGGLSPLFQVMFIFQSFPPAARELSGLLLTELERPVRSAQFDLILTITESEAGLAGSLLYDTDLFEPATMAHTVAHFKMLLEEVAADPDRELAGISLLRETQVRDLAGSFNEEL